MPKYKKAKIEEQRPQTDVIKRITKTDAKEKYLLKDSDLEKLECEQKRSPTYRNTIMKLYVLSEVEALALHIWGDENMIAEEKERRSVRRTELRENRRARDEARRQVLMAKYEIRRKELSRALAIYGLKIRHDSKMCDAYIDGSIDDLEHVVDICRKMNWLHNKTDYAKRLDKEIKDSFKHYGSCDIEDEVDCMQHTIIEEHGGCKPWVEDVLETL